MDHRQARRVVFQLLAQYMERCPDIFLGVEAEDEKRLKNAWWEIRGEMDRRSRKREVP